jgi:putative isomerase
VVPGPHAWDGSYTDLRVTWKGHSWRIQSAHDAGDLVLLATPLPSKPISALPPTLVVSVDFLWNRPGTTLRRADFIETRGAAGPVPVYCTCNPPSAQAESDDYADVPVAAPYFSVDFTAPAGISTGRRRTLAEIEAIVERQRQAYEQSIAAAGSSAPILDAIETTLGWDTIYEPNQRRVISPVSRAWNLNFGGYVLFDWDTFFAATLASIGDRDLAYANAMEILREETPNGFVPNLARPGGWKTFDHSEPPVGAITVLGLYRQFHDRWFLQDTFAAAAELEPLVGPASPEAGLPGLGQRRTHQSHQSRRQLPRNRRGDHLRIRPRQQPHVRRRGLRSEVAPDGDCRCGPDEYVHRRLRRTGPDCR